MFKRQYDFKNLGRSISDWLGEKSFSSIMPKLLDNNSISYLNVNVSQDEVIEYRLVMIELIKYGNLDKIQSLAQKIGRILLDDEIIIRQAIISQNNTIFKFILHNANPEYSFNLEILSFLISNASVEMVEEYCIYAGKDLSSLLLNSAKILVPIMNRDDAQILVTFEKYNFVDIEEIGEYLLKASVQGNKLNIIDWLLRRGVAADSESILEKSALDIAFYHNNIEVIKRIIKLDKNISQERRKELRERLGYL